MFKSKVEIVVFFWVFRTWHLLGFKFDFLSFSQLWILFKEFCKVVFDWLKVFVSFAKKLMLLLTSISEAILFMYIINNSGPINPPWETPLKIGKDFENVLLITTF